MYKYRKEYEKEMTIVGKSVFVGAVLALQNLLVGDDVNQLTELLVQ
jgi:hypothetical protein